MTENQSRMVGISQAVFMFSGVGSVFFWCVYMIATILKQIGVHESLVFIYYSALSLLFTTALFGSSYIIEAILMKINTNERWGNSDTIFLVLTIISIIELVLVITKLTLNIYLYWPPWAILAQTIIGLSAISNKNWFD